MTWKPRENGKFQEIFQIAQSKPLGDTSIHSNSSTGIKTGAYSVQIQGRCYAQQLPILEAATEPTSEMNASYFRTKIPFLHMTTQGLV